jgi:hypothetical protein
MAKQVRKAPPMSMTIVEPPLEIEMMWTPRILLLLQYQEILGTPQPMKTIVLA